ncbi:hypothetical protein DMA11_16545 [Marinilabiliaceae bacterium JC017]|nr:hypothetical protein DMA11_16545 [Marinilabiliaceae bacterium JC017]
MCLNLFLGCHTEWGHNLIILHELFVEVIVKTVNKQGIKAKYLQKYGINFSYSIQPELIPISD